jgi:hypothetical protein
MSERSKRSERRRRRQYISDDEEDDETKVTRRRRRYICDDEEDDETEVTTPLPSSAGEASTARNSAMRPPAASQAARPFHASLSDLPPPSATPAKRIKTLARMKIFRGKNKLTEDRIDYHPRNEPNEKETLPPCSEKTYLAASKSVPSSWKKLKEKCTGEENERKAVTPLRYSSAWKDSTARNSAMNGRRPPLLDDEELSDATCPPKKRICFRINEKKMEGKVDERRGGEDENNPRNEPSDSYIHRVLTDVDTQIGLLNGIIDYHSTNGRYPFHDYNALDDFVDNWLQVDVPEDEELIDLVRKLRTKYLRTMARKGATGDFADPRDQIAFNLANKIWGAGSNDEYWKSLKLMDFYSSSST